MREQVGRRTNAAQRMKNSRVAKVDLRGLDQALAEVRLPRKQAADHERLLQGIQVGAGRVRSDAHRCRDLAAVPNLRMVVRKHRPKPTHHRRQHAEPKRSQVAIQKGADEIFPPVDAVGVIRGQKRPGKSPALPEQICLAGPRFRHVESLHLNGLHSPGQ
jgi:hypothetical protein